MNLIIDAGNTQVKWGVFQEGALLYRGSEKEWSGLIKALTDVELDGVGQAIISSTRKLSPPFLDFLEEQGISIWYMKADMALPFELDYLTPETIGVDRIAGIAGAQAAWPGENVLVVDLGTAITYDLILDGKVFIGGNISPGMHIRFQSLNRFTDNLPLVEPAEEVPELGKTTTDAIRSGVQTGILFEITAYINSLKNKYNELTVILTGGDAEFFVKKLKKTIFVDANLVLKGLNHILAYQLQVQSGRK